MRILIIEDDQLKCEQIVRHLNTLGLDLDIVTKYSYQSGRLQAVLSRPDFIILDMSLPTYDVTEVESGHRMRFDAGQDILRELKRKKITSKVVVVTQYEHFGDAGKTKKLSELSKELRNQYGDQFLGAIVYQPSDSKWKQELTKAISETF